jgi:hypothetical protein
VPAILFAFDQGDEPPLDLRRSLKNYTASSPKCPVIVNGTLNVTIPQFGERISSVSYVSSSPVPEPATLGLFGVGLLALNTLRKRRRRKQQ